MKKILILIFVFLILIRFSSAFPNYIIKGDKVYVNDSKIYLSAEPHTTYGRDVYLELTSKLYTGDVNLVFGFQNDTYKPIELAVYHPYNLTVERNYTCNYDFDYTLNPKRAWCYQSYPNGSISIYFNHTFDKGNIATKTIYWDETKQYNYKIKQLDVTKVKFKYDDVNTWTVAHNVPIIKNNVYKSRIKLKPTKKKAGIEKYWICIYPSSYNMNIRQAKQDNKLYCLDPWVGSPPDNGMTYWDLTNTTDLWGNNDAVNHGCDVSSSYVSFNISGSSGNDSFKAIKGNKDYIDASSIADSLTSGDALSISFWINATDNWGTTDYEALVYEYTNDNLRWFLMSIPTGNIRMLSYNGGSQYSDIPISTCGLVNNKWNHFVLSTDGSTNTEVWINGKNVHNMTHPLYTGFDNSNSLWFMQGSYGSGINPMGGTIDDIKIYNSTLNSSQIINLYNYGNITAPSPSPSGDCSCPSPASNWDIDASNNCTIDSACDISGYDLTISGTGTITFNATVLVNKLLNLSSTHILDILKNFTITSGTFTMNGGTLNIKGSKFQTGG